MNGKSPMRPQGDPKQRFPSAKGKSPLRTPNREPSPSASRRSPAMATRKSPTSWKSPAMPINGRSSVDQKTAPVVRSLGCLKLASSSHHHHQETPVSVAASPMHGGKAFASPLFSFEEAPLTSVSRRDHPFHGLVICVTGLSKGARKQVEDATKRLGGEYSPDLHPQCTHLVVQSFSGRKFEHALKHGSRRGLFLVTLAWFVNSVKQHERLDESPYCVRKLLSSSSGAPSDEVAQFAELMGKEHSCLPLAIQEDRKALTLSPALVSNGSKKELVKKEMGMLSGMCFYIDPALPENIKEKVMESSIKEGARFTDHWFIGCEATHVICEGDSALKYFGLTNLVTPLWLFKTVRERHLQRLVQISADISRHMSMFLDTSHTNHTLEPSKVLSLCGVSEENEPQDRLKEREEKMIVAKAGVRRRRGPRMQPCYTLPRPISPAILLESVCWTVTDPPSVACFFIDSAGSAVYDGQHGESSERGSVLVDQHTLSRIPEDEIYTRPMSESEREEIVFKGAFLTLLFPIDRFSELGPSSRAFFSERGFNRRQILQLIYYFYQEYMPSAEIDVAVHSDSKNADKLRSVFSCKEALELGFVPMKRYEFLGSRKSFEGLKRLGRENSGQVYELCLGA